MTPPLPGLLQFLRLPGGIVVAVQALGVRHHFVGKEVGVLTAAAPAPSGQNSS